MADLKVKSTTESGLLAAVTVIMGLIAVYMPVLGVVATLLWPLPIIILVVRHGLRSGILSVIAAALIMSALISPLNSIHLIATFAPPSLVLGYGFRQQAPATQILLTGLVSSIIGVGLATGLLMAVSGINPFDIQSQMSAMQEAMDSTFAIYESLGMSPEEIQSNKDKFQMVFSMMSVLMPLAIISAGMITTWLNFTIGGKVLRRLGYQVTTLPPFDQWHLPKALLYVFAFSLIGLYWGSTHNIELLYQISLNANLLVTFAGFIQGVAVLSCLSRNRLSRWVFWLIMFFVFMNGVFAQILAFVGLFDMFFDYRKRFRQH